MKKYSLAILAITLATMTQVAAVSPTLTGASGLITMPTGEALKYKEVSIAYDHIFADKEKNDEWFYKANVGTFQNWELGVVGGSSPEEGMFLNTKYYLISDQSKNPFSVAVGVQNIASEDDADLYMAMSKRFMEGIGLHLGFKANFDQEINPTIMAGADYYVTDRIQLMLDVTGEKEEYSGNIGGMLFITKELFIRGSIIDITENLYEKRRSSIGIGFSKYL